MMMIRDVGFCTVIGMSAGRIVDHIISMPYQGLWVESLRFACGIVIVAAFARIFDVLNAKRKKLWQR